MELKSVQTPVITYMYLTTALGDKIDIRLQMVSLTLYEDIFSPVLNGEIDINDNLGMFDNFPISGNETLTVKFYSYGFDQQKPPLIEYIHRTFDILKITNITTPNEYTKRYTLLFASPELKKNETIKISKAYPQITSSTVLSNIMTADYDNEENEPLGLGFPTTPHDDDSDALTSFSSPFLTSDDVENHFQQLDDGNSIELFIEKTKYIEPWITIPYMKPFEIFNWLAARALRESGGRYNNNSANFLFFENKRGFQFVTLDTLFENKDVATKSTLQYGNALQNQAVGQMQNRTIFIDRIERLKFEDCYDILSNIRNGLYSSQLFTYDISNGNVTEKDFDYIDQFYKVESVDRDDVKNGQLGPPTGDYPQIMLDAAGKNPLTTKPLSHRMFLPIFASRDKDNITSASTGRLSGTKVSVGLEEYIQLRISELAKITNFRITVDISGNSKHKVGDIIELDLKYWSQSTDDSARLQTLPHKYLQGNYLITAIKHVLTNTTYKMSIELAKDSLRAKIGK